MVFTNKDKTDVVFTNKDKTDEIDAKMKAIQIHPTDICSYYKKHPYTILWKRECWTCAYSDFGIDTGSPTNIGTCKYCNFSKS